MRVHILDDSYNSYDEYDFTTVKTDENSDDMKWINVNDDLMYF